jgi:hypothetical protein
MSPCTRTYTKEKIYNSLIKSRSLYKTTVRPILTYAAESWALTNKVERALMTWGRKILRKIYGPTYENG